MPHWFVLVLVLLIVIVIAIEGRERHDLTDVSGLVRLH